MNIIFHAHSGLRWLVLAGILLILIKSVIGLFSNSPYSKFDKILGSATVGIMDLQLLLGIVLYVAYSPYTKNFTFDMANATERFWAVEHLSMMLLAIAAAHIGKSKAKKAANPKTQFRLQTMFFSVSLVLILLGIPWDRM